MESVLWSISFTPHLMFESFPHHTFIQSKLGCLEKQELVLPEDTNPTFCHSRLVKFFVSLKQELALGASIGGPSL